MVWTAIYQLAWPHLLSGCNINRRTDEMLANVGLWDKNELEVPKGEFHWDIIPNITGRLVKV